jgi:hypothetical protein
MRASSLGVLAVALAAAGVLGVFLYRGLARRIIVPRIAWSPVDPGLQAKRDFYRKHPGRKPLNWKIGAKAEEFYRTRPMGKFALHKNDCSDFTEAVVDDALGARARFRRNSDRHVLMRKWRLWDIFYWDREGPLLPGDIVSVEHSPHYEPYEGAIWHVGVVGTDSMVYDWTKLRVWSKDRYGRHSIEWFTRHAHGPRSVEVWRLKDVYRFKGRPVPIDGG